MGGTLLPQLLVWAKSIVFDPIIVIWLILRVSLPRLVRVTGTGLLDVPTFWFPKLIPIGESFTAVPVPESEIV